MVVQDHRFPTDERIIREHNHIVEVEIAGDHLIVDLRTHDGRMAARMYAYSIADRDPGIARAILSRVGQEG